MANKYASLFQDTQSAIFQALCELINEMHDGKTVTFGNIIDRLPYVDWSNREQMTNFLQAIFDFGTDTPERNSVARPVSDKPVPFVPSRIELLWLKGMLADDKTAFLLSPELREKLKHCLESVPMIEVSTYWEQIRETGDDTVDPHLQSTLNLLAQALQNKVCVRYRNETRQNGENVGTAAPVRLEYDVYAARWRVIFWLTDEERAIKANVSRLNDLTLTDTPCPNDLDVRFRQFLDVKERTVVLTLRPLYNAVERCFALFSTYDKEAVFLEKEDRYRLTVHYYDFDRQEMIYHVLSLGAAVAVEEPSDFREEIIRRLREAKTVYDSQA